MMKKIGDAHTSVVPKDTYKPEPRTLGRPQPVEEKKPEGEKGEGR